jgi:hypothetical protein
MKLFEEGISYWKLKYCCEYCANHSRYLWAVKYDHDKNYYCLHFKPKRKIKRDFKDRVWEAGYGTPSSDEIFPRWCPLEEVKDGKKT